MALQYDAPVTTEDFAAALAANPSISANTTAAINALLGLDTAGLVVVAGWDGLSSDLTAPEGSTPDVVSIAIAGTDPVNLNDNLPESVANAPVIIIQSDADVTLTVGQETNAFARVAVATEELADRIIVSGNGNDTITVLGNTNVTLDGGNGNDHLITSDGDDVVTGGAGDDTIDTGAGNDTIITGFGNDIINAGEGHDLIQVTAESTAFDISVADGALVLTGTGSSAGDSVTVTDAEFVTFKDGHTLAIANTEDEGTALNLYSGLLGRDADEGGAENFTTLISGGTSLTTVTESFLNSDEYYGILRNDFITDLYESLLGREVDASGQATWLEQFEQGATRGEIVAAIADSAEGQAAASTDADFISALYESALGREAEQGGLDNWVSLLSSGTSRTDVADAIYSSTEAVTKNNADFVDSLYENALGVSATEDTAGKAGWMAALEHGATQAEVAIGIVGSPEAQDHITNVVVVHGAV